MAVGRPELSETHLISSRLLGERVIDTTEDGIDTEKKSEICEKSGVPSSLMER